MYGIKINIKPYNIILYVIVYLRLELLHIGTIYSLNNRHLYAFHQAGIDNIPYVWATPEEVLLETAWKFTTPNNGTSVTVRGGNR